MKKYKSKAFILLSIFAVLSFITNIVASYKNPKFDFYFPLCRFWQMAIGGLLAIKTNAEKSKTISNILSIIGIILILGSSILLS